MSHSGSRQNNVRHKSHADIKGARMQSTTDKVGGEDEAARILVNNNNNGKIQMVFKRSTGDNKHRQ